MKTSPMTRTLLLMLAVAVCIEALPHDEAHLSSEIVPEDPHAGQYSPTIALLKAPAPSTKANLLASNGNRKPLIVHFEDTLAENDAAIFQMPDRPEDDLYDVPVSQYVVTDSALRNKGISANNKLTVQATSETEAATIKAVAFYTYDDNDRYNKYKMCQCSAALATQEFESESVPTVESATGPMDIGKYIDEVKCRKNMPEDAPACKINILSVNSIRIAQEATGQESSGKVYPASIHGKTTDNDDVVKGGIRICGLSLAQCHAKQDAIGQLLTSHEGDYYSVSCNQEVRTQATTVGYSGCVHVEYQILCDASCRGKLQDLLNKNGCTGGAACNPGNVVHGGEAFNYELMHQLNTAEIKKGHYSIQAPMAHAKPSLTDWACTSGSTCSESSFVQPVYLECRGKQSGWPQNKPTKSKWEWTARNNKANFCRDRCPFHKSFGRFKANECHPACSKRCVGCLKCSGLHDYYKPKKVNVVGVHNTLRKSMGLSLLTWSKDLRKSSEKVARNICKTGTFEHSQGNYAENLYRIDKLSGSHCQDITDSKKQRRCIQGNAAVYWAKEANWYRYGRWATCTKTLPPYHTEHLANVNRDAVGHFTTMANAEATMLGCAVKKCDSEQNKDWIVVCHYNPEAQNVVGKFPFSARAAAAVVQDKETEQTSDDTALVNEPCDGAMTATERHYLEALDRPAQH